MTEKTVKEVEIKPVAKLEEEGDIAADYLEGLLDIADLDGDIDIDVENNRASVAIVGAKLDNLVGRDGEVLDALQELTRLAVQSSTGDRSRLMRVALRVRRGSRRCHAIIAGLSPARHNPRAWRRSTHSRGVGR